MGYRVGIDLGTTNSAIAYTELGRQRCQKVEANEFTSAVMPSCVGLLSNGEYVVGGKARRVLERVSEFKRSIGTDDSWQLGKDLLSPVELSAMVLRKLREGFEGGVGQIDGAVITVPALFNDRQRRETMEAGRLAGLNVLRRYRARHAHRPPHPGRRDQHQWRDEHHRRPAVWRLQGQRRGP
jgi:molecular chaperone DnaK (HSP70)